ncbi:hypothetical protein HXX76_007882 [Chlamydomonas incerta]|uniref:HMG box domain-containing protein n=1 Tax=Chlamydomonas incerta TaxID=51695 RepID=A0A835VZY6_CHLIN|nr:hypothetical protein HXX76_007882 [Chlamydomonas incerta]|eukprot:KAG2434155.1 hypothetical protein HXX76_007882 [Chlamydomonas incerta]
MLRASLRTVPRAVAPARRAMVVRAFTEGSDAMSAAKKETKPAKKAVEKKPKAEAKPQSIRKAPTAYNLFYKATFPQARSENPDKKVIQLGSVVHEKWTAISAEERAPFEAQAAELKKVVDAQRAELLAAKKAAARPMTAYLLFAGAKRAEMRAQNPDKSMAQLAKLLGAMWKGMSEEEQKPYRDQAKEAMAAWMAKQHPQQESASA